MSRENITDDTIFLKMLLIIVFVVAIVFVGYAFILPKFFRGYQTYSIFIIGAMTTFVAGVALFLKKLKKIEIIWRILISVIFGIIASALFSFFELFLILNIIGS